MTVHRLAWRLVDRARAFDRALTRREGRRSVLIDSRTPMNYAMAAPIQAALAGDSRVRFYVTSTERGANASAVHTHLLPGTTVLAPWEAALKRIDVYLTADLLWARLPRGTRRIQMFHGVAGKFQHDYDRPQSSMRRWHRLFFVNQRRLRNFIAAGAIDPLERGASTHRNAEGRLPRRWLGEARRRAAGTRSGSRATHRPLCADLVGRLRLSTRWVWSWSKDWSPAPGTSSSSCTIARAIHARSIPAALTGDVPLAGVAPRARNAGHESQYLPVPRRGRHDDHRP